MNANERHELDQVRRKIRLLELAKLYIHADHPLSGLCLALRQAYTELRHSAEPEANCAPCHETNRAFYLDVAHQSLEIYITRALVPDGYLQAWQVRKLPKEYTQPYIMPDNWGQKQTAMAQLAADRLAWIDWIINCLKEDNGLLGDEA